VSVPTPVEINYHQDQKLLKINFNNNTECMLSAEFLRVFSPSAEVQGHHPSEAVLQIGKKMLKFKALSLLVIMLSN